MLTAFFMMFIFYDLKNASRSLLIVAASVAGMPCGKPG